MTTTLMTIGDIMRLAENTVRFNQGLKAINDVIKKYENAIEKKSVLNLSQNLCPLCAYADSTRDKIPEKIAPKKATRILSQCQFCPHMLAGWKIKCFQQSSFSQIEKYTYHKDFVANINRLIPYYKKRIEHLEELRKDFIEKYGGDIESKQ